MPEMILKNKINQNPNTEGEIRLGCISAASPKYGGFFAPQKAQQHPPGNRGRHFLLTKWWHNMKRKKVPGEKACCPE